MIQILLTCFWGGVSLARPLYPDAQYTPAASGTRPLCASKGVTFCEEVDKYPTKLITDLLQQKLFPVDELFTDEREGLDEPPPEYMFNEDLFLPEKTPKMQRKTRSTSENSEGISQNHIKKCQGMNRTVEPKLAINKVGEWKYIVQDKDSKKRQRISVHLCNKNEECNRRCHQFYSSVPMISVDSNGLSREERFWMPSSCHCMENLPKDF